MKRSLLLTLLFFIHHFGNIALANHNTDYGSNKTSIDSLILKKKNNQKIKGIFKGITNDSITLITKENIVYHIRTNDIKKIKIFHQKSRKTLSTVATILGGIIVISGAVTLGIGAIAILVKNTSILVYGAAVTGTGIGTMIGGKIILTKTFRLHKEWSILNNNT